MCEVSLEYTHVWRAEVSIRCPPQPYLLSLRSLDAFGAYQFR